MVKFKEAKNAGSLQIDASPSEKGTSSHVTSSS